jgi:fermentation-respiration switch protein FrsA (DUF1100 family)
VLGIKNSLQGLLTLLAAALVFAAPAAASAVPSWAGGGVSPNNVVAQPTAGSAKAWIIVIHGGGWAGGQSLMVPDEGVASGFNAKGYGTYMIDYRSGYDSYADTVAAYDWLVAHLKSQYAGRTVPPICAWGESAGGHLALMLAAARPLKCVISQAGPTDFLTLLAESTAAHLKWEPFGWETMVLPAWGSALSAFSPVNHCSMTAHYLLGASSNDPLVPPAQMNDYKAKCLAGRTVLLDGNPKDGTLVKWTHAGVTTAAEAAWQADESALLPH